MTTIRRAVSPVLLSALCAALGSCAARHADHDVAPDAPLARLTSCMTGSFSSAEQSASDPDNFRDVRLHMARVWPQRSDGPWLYVEQAMAASLDKPYRQRLYRLSARPDRSMVSEVYELPGDPLAYAGAWRDPARLGAIAPNDLMPRAGCDIVLREQPDGTFVGSTGRATCPSTLRGAAYATSEVTISPGLLVSWDRGYDAQGQQVWGATQGGYRFVKSR